MRNYLFLLTIILAACSSDDGGLGSNRPTPQPLQHAPEISALELSPNSAAYMEGDGVVNVTVQATVRDDGLDVRTLVAEFPDGTRIEFDQQIDTLTGTLTEEFQMSTESPGSFPVDFWLLDEAGNSSGHRNAEFNVVGDVQASDWTVRLGDMPFVLNDVTWDGNHFIAVGDGGAILVSADGIDWTEVESLSDANLLAVASRGADTVVVGSDATVLLSSDGGATWSVKHSGSRVGLSAVAVTESRIVAGGMDQLTGDAFIMWSRDRGAHWTEVETLAQTGHFLTDLVHVNGLFVAATDALSWMSDARVLVSLDGNIWHDIVLRDEVAASYAILHGGGQFIAAGSDSTVFASADGFNWTQLQTPVQQVDYLSAAWNGSKLVVAGGITWWYWWVGTPPFERPVGLSSADGGATWEAFNIDGYYQSRGLAWGNGRFVTVGQTTPVSGRGAIYTSE